MPSADHRDSSQTSQTLADGQPPNTHSTQLAISIYHDIGKSNDSTESDPTAESVLRRGCVEDKHWNLRWWGWRRTSWSTISPPSYPTFNAPQIIKGISTRRSTCRFRPLSSIMSKMVRLAQVPRGFGLLTISRWISQLWTSSPMTTATTRSTTRKSSK